MTDEILYSVADGIATITLNRPDRMNAMLPGMGELYADLLQRADADPDVRVIVVTGAGKGFCAGADLSVLAEGTAGLNKYVDEQSVEEVSRPLGVSRVSLYKRKQRALDRLRAMAGVSEPGPEVPLAA